MAYFRLLKFGKPYYNKVLNAHMRFRNTSNVGSADGKRHRRTESRTVGVDSPENAWVHRIWEAKLLRLPARVHLAFPARASTSGQGFFAGDGSARVARREPSGVDLLQGRSRRTCSLVFACAAPDEARESSDRDRRPEGAV